MSDVIKPKAVSPKEHASLSPSAAERWIECPASIRMGNEVEVVGQPGTYAREGTAAHERAEMEIRLQILKSISDNEYSTELEKWKHRYSEYDQDEIEVYVSSYLELIQSRLALYPNSVLLIEQAVDTGVPHCWGTADTVIMSPAHVEIIDFKYGAGVWVSTEDNPQLMLYGVGALEEFGDVLGDTEIIYMTIFQPRMDNVQTVALNPDELRAWRDGIIPIAEEALSDHAHFSPSDKTCRWCPASGLCRAQLEWATSRDFDTPDILSPEEIADALDQADTIREWLNALERQALNLAYDQRVSIPRYKVVRSGGRRYISDSELALKLLTEDGYPEYEVSERKIVGILELEKLLGKEKFAILLKDVVKKSDGKISLVGEDDKRESIDPNIEAAKDFGDE